MHIYKTLHKENGKILQIVYHNGWCPQKKMYLPDF